MAHPLIEKLFKKRGIKSVEELQPDEKADFDRYQKILSTEEVEMPQLKDFLRTQKFLIEGKFELDNPPEKAKNLELQFIIYSKILNFLEGPKAERESLIKYLESQV